MNLSEEDGEADGQHNEGDNKDDQGGQELRGVGHQTHAPLEKISHYKNVDLVSKIYMKLRQCSKHRRLGRSGTLGVGHQIHAPLQKS